MTTGTDTITHPTPGAPAAPTETFAEIDLEGVGFPLESQESPPAADTSPVPVEAPQAASVVAAPTPIDARRSRGDLRKALHEERGRAKFWRDQAEGLQRGRQQVQPLNLTSRGPRIDAAEVAEVAREADKSVGFGEPVAKVLQLVDQKLQQMAVAVERGLREQEIQRLERRFVRDHPDYYETLTRAGIYQAVGINPTTGQSNDPKIAKLIYEEGSDHPPEAAYHIAKALLGETVTEETHPEPPGPGGSQPAPSLLPPSSPVAPDVALEAERRGARQVAERVIDNQSKPRGIRVLRSAGVPPKIELNDELRLHLDREMDRNPSAVMTFFDKNPTVRKWWES